MKITLTLLTSEELKQQWKQAFTEQDIFRPDEYYDKCLAENAAGVRDTIIAYADDQVAGGCHLKYESDYPPFQEQGIPEVNDLNVFPVFQRQGIGNRILEEFESIVSRKGKRIGIGVGLFKDYGKAQRIYCRRGYIPDGNGIVYKNQPVVPGEMVRVDDDLNLFFIKELQ